MFETIPCQKKFKHVLGDLAIDEIRSDRHILRIYHFKLQKVIIRLNTRISISLYFFSYVSHLASLSLSVLFTRSMCIFLTSLPFSRDAQPRQPKQTHTSCISFTSTQEHIWPFSIIPALHALTFLGFAKAFAAPPCNLCHAVGA